VEEIRRGDGIEKTEGERENGRSEIIYNEDLKWEILDGSFTTENDFH
jgi:hypothetical protein